MMNISASRCILSAAILSVLLVSGAPAGGRSASPGAGTPAPKRELRAAWVTTVAGLDWPQSIDPTEQRRSLRELVDNLARAHFNAIFFQVRGRADAVYRSRFEPWSAQLTGTLGEDPGWDPLSALIGLAHDRGLEVHAWFNTFLVKTGGPKPAPTRPRHLLLAHPEWVRDVNGEAWCDPGLPEVRKYLVSVALDIVRRYDIDGIQFDYARYPNRPFPDDATYRRYGGGIPKDAWRRDNVSRFIGEFHDSLLLVRPGLPVGATPIGIYNASSGARGLRGYADVYQDARRWMREGWLDYCVPQIYWPISDSKNDPNFTLLAREWISASPGRLVAIGTGAYKPEVFSQLPILIDSIRRCGAAGVAFFRYDNIRNAPGMNGRFGTPALLPRMPWIDSIPPEPPRNLAIINTAGGVVELDWSRPVPARDGDDVQRYCVYRSPVKPVNTDSAANLLAVVPAASGRYLDTITRASAPGYFYAVSSLDRRWNESVPAVERATVPEVSALSREYVLSTRLGPAYHAPGASLLLIPFELRDAVPVIIKILDSGNREVAGVVDAQRRPGRYVASADVGKLPGGTYTCLMVAGNLKFRKTLTL